MWPPCNYDAIEGPYWWPYGTVTTYSDRGEKAYRIAKMLHEQKLMDLDSPEKFIALIDL